LGNGKLPKVAVLAPKAAPVVGAPKAAPVAGAPAPKAPEDPGVPNPPLVPKPPPNPVPNPPPVAGPPKAAGAGEPKAGSAGLADPNCPPAALVAALVDAKGDGAKGDGAAPVPTEDANENEGAAAVVAPKGEAAAPPNGAPASALKAPAGVEG